MRKLHFTSALACLLLGCVAQAGPVPSYGVPRIEVTPKRAFIDQPVKILLRDFPARCLVTVQLVTTNLAGQAMQSHAEFLTDRRGNASLATQAPKSGSYRLADPAGLFWSLSIAGSNTAALKKGLAPRGYVLTASVGDRTVATATLERFILSPGVRKINVRDHGLRGSLFLPAGKGPWPGIIVLGGSDGGVIEAPAAYLAAKGYAAFALAYFDYEDLPMSLENIPLEYFQTAIHWLQARDDIKPNSVAVMGASRGGELALLLGATFPDVHAVVAISASCVLWGGLSTNAGAWPQPAWIYHGKPLPFMPEIKLTDDQQRELWQLSRTNSAAVDLAWLSFQLENKAAVAKATIPVEKINGSVLLISGDDDKLWPSTEMENLAMKRLDEARHPFPDRHLAYRGAGHMIPFAYTPTTVNMIIHPVTKERIVLGGDPEDTAAAAADVWPRVIDFLNQSLKRDRHSLKKIKGGNMPAKSDRDF